MQILEVTFSIDLIHSLTNASLPAANQELRPNLLTDLMIQPPNVQMEELYALSTDKVNPNLHLFYNVMDKL